MDKIKEIKAEILDIMIYRDGVILNARKVEEEANKKINELFKLLNELQSSSGVENDNLDAGDRDSSGRASA